MSTIAAQAGILSADAMIENARSMAGVAKVGAEVTEGAVPRDAMRRVQRAWAELADALEYCQEVMAESIRDDKDV